MDTIRVILVDDHVLLRAGLRSLLQGTPGIEVVAEANDGREALELVRQNPPHVVSTDIGMPNMNGLEMTSRLAKEFPSVRVLILSMHSSEEYVFQALRAGAAGYILKGSPPHELEMAIRTVARGDSFLTPSVSKAVIDRYIARPGAESDPRELLTPRQREILQLIAEGLTTKEIARTIGRGVKTVETHRSQLMERLNLHDVAGLVRYAIRTGLIQPDR